MNSDLSIAINEIFDVLLKLVRSNRNLKDLLNDAYKNALIDYLKIIPEDKQIMLCKAYDKIKNLLSCINFNKLISIANSSNIPSFEIDTKKILCDIIIDKIGNKQDRKFIEKLLEKLNNIFIIIDYIIKNPKEIAGNANVFASYNDDDLFN